MLNRAVICSAVICALFLVTTERTTAQETSNAIESPSVERVRTTLKTTPRRSLKFDARMPVPAATFRVTVNERAFVVPILESLRKEFELTPLQKQSADWASKCCGLNVATLMDDLDRAIRKMQERRARERVARELAEVVAAANK